MIHTYTVYRVNLNGSLSNKEHLYNLDDLNTWIASVYGKHATILLVSDLTNVRITMIDNGEWFEKI